MTDWSEAIHALPVAVVITSATGVIAESNRTFERMFGSRLSGRPLADIVVSEDRGRLAEPSVLPDDTLVRLTSGRNAWISSRVIGQRRCVVCLRAAEFEDAATAAPHTPILHIGVLGRCRIEDGARDEAWLEQRPGQLLRLLVASRERVLTTDEITDALWPDGDARSPATVRYLVHTLRAHLEPDRPARGASSFVLSHRGGYRLDTDRVVIDAEVFEREARDGLAAHAAGGDTLARRLLERAVGRYRGDFLAEEPYADWAAPERERLRELMAHALRALAELEEAAADLEAAARHLGRLAALEPLDAGIHRDLIALCLRRGRHGEAARRYDALRRRMASASCPGPGFTLEGLSAG